MKRASNSLLEAVDAAFDLPRNVNLMLKRLSTGTVRLEVVDTDLKKLQMALDRASDKIMIGLVVAALVVGSSLVLQASPIAYQRRSYGLPCSVIPRRCSAGFMRSIMSYS